MQQAPTYFMNPLIFGNFGSSCTPEGRDSSVKIEFEKRLNQEELSGSYVKKAPLPVVYYEGAYWVEEGGRPKWYATIKEINSSHLSANLIDRIESLLIARDIEIGSRNSTKDTAFLYCPAPDPFSLDLRIIPFCNDINFAMRTEKKRLEDIP